MKIGLFGGSFDPVHHGHLAIARAALAGASLDRVVFMPSAQAPLKIKPTQTSAEHRLAMLRLATSGESRFAVSDWEIARGGISYTIETVRAWRTAHPADELFWIIGADQAMRLSEWRAITELMQLCTFVALARPGCPKPQPPPSVPGLRLLVCPSELVDVSSSDIRAGSRSHAALAGLCPENVVAYIQANGLYRAD